MIFILTLLGVGFICAAAVGLWCIVRVGDDTHRPRQAERALTVYLMEREQQRLEELKKWNRLVEEAKWRIR